MRTWIVPFIFLALLLAAYLFSPEQRRRELQEHIRREVNALLIMELALIVLTLLPLLFFRQRWLRYIDWIALLACGYIAYRRIMSPDEPPADTSEPPL
jgi:hypothetical protein